MASASAAVKGEALFYALKTVTHGRSKIYLALGLHFLTDKYYFLQSYPHAPVSFRLSYTVSYTSTCGKARRCLCCWCGKMFSFAPLRLCTLYGLRVGVGWVVQLHSSWWLKEQGRLLDLGVWAVVFLKQFWGLLVLVFICNYCIRMLGF